jgi:hypothetical protein
MSGIKVSGGPDMTKAAGKISDAIDTAEVDIAQDAYNEIQKRLRAVLQNPTGRYQGRIQTSTQSDSLMVSDGGIVYGPWLEGTSSRNGRSRFKGYHVFRTVLQQMDKKAESVTEQAIGEAVRKL